MHMRFLQIGNDFKTIVSQVGEIGSNLLLKGEKFYVKADGHAKGFVIKDLELAATSTLIEKNQKISAKPGTELKHDKLLQIYVTKSNAYVCIFVDEGYDAEDHGPFSILIGTILSARTKDESTTRIVKDLFKVYKNARQLSKAKLKDVEKIIKSIGFYHVKAERIICR